MFSLPGAVRRALDALTGAGYEAWIVGGCVRDLLRGETPSDYDITTSALPEETERVFAGERLIETGLRHGTVTVLLDGLPLEITTYRVETTYSDNRHPDSVRFTRSLREDAARRDFTVNAMAWNGTLADYFGGQDDLARGLIRCVGDPDERFREDALRILRAIRFASVLDFRIEPETRAAAVRNRALLQNVSAERIAAELKKLLCGRGVRRVLTEEWEILGAVLPEILPAVGFDQRNYHHIYDVWTHTAFAVEAAPPEPRLRLALLLHDLGKPDCFAPDENGVGHFKGHARRSTELAEQILDRLKLDNATRKAVLELVLHHDTPIEPEPKAVRRALNRLTPALYFDLLAVRRADNLAQAPEYQGRQLVFDELEALGRQVLAEAQCFSLRDLAVNGDDLLQAGFAPGRELGQTLQALLDAVIAGDVPNDRTALLALAAAGR